MADIAERDGEMLSDEARLEIELFRHHLSYHKKGEEVSDCRFCSERLRVRRAASGEDADHE